MSFTKYDKNSHPVISPTDDWNELVNYVTGSITSANVLSGSIQAYSLVVPYQSTSGSAAASLYMKVVITGSTYVIPLYESS